MSLGQSTEQPQLNNGQAEYPVPRVDMGQYRRDGFALIEDFLSRDELAMLRDRNDPDLPRELGAAVGRRRA